MKLKWLEIFVLMLLIPMAVYGEVTVKKELGKDVYKDSKGKKYQTTEIPLVSDYSYKKPNIVETKILDKDEQDVVEFSLKQNGRKLVHNQLRHVKNDYKNDFDRGTVEYTPKCRNYSHQKVVIPDGTTIRDTNFSASKPNTKVIEGKNLIFIDCNLTNNIIDPTWIVDGKHIDRTTQVKWVKKSEVDLGSGKKQIIVSLQVQEDKPNGKFVEQQEEVWNTTDADEYNLAVLQLSE